MTAAEAAALDLLVVDHYRDGMPVTELPADVVDGLVDQGLAFIRHGWPPMASQLVATPAGEVESYTRWAYRYEPAIVA